MTKALPTIDLRHFDGPPDVRSFFLKRLRDALHGRGFFYLVGHGVDAALIDDVLAAAKAFFALPMADKLDIAMLKSPHFRGYTAAGQERTRGQPDWREQLDFNTESAPFACRPDTPAWRRLQGPNQWPAAMPALKPIMLAYQAEVTRVGIALLEAIAIALGQPANVFATIYEPNPSQLTKIIHYPGRDAAASDQGVGAHRDGGFVTLLLQDGVPGLRVQTLAGEWIDVLPIRGSFVVNAGELIELATNGFVRAAVHDVVAPPAGLERYSVAFFLGSRPDAIVPVIELPEALKPAVRGMSVDPLNPIFREVGRNQLKSRLRSHPDVALVHYPELVERGALTSD